MTAVNVPTPIETEFDPFASASDPVLKTFDLFGVVEINAWGCALVTGVGKVPFDPQNPAHKRFTAIDIFIQPLPEMDIKYPKTCEDHVLAESKEWANITLASIKAAGINNVRECNGKYARVARIPNGKKYPAKDRATGQPTGEMKDETTFKFIEFYADEAACRAAYIAAGGQATNSTPAPVADPNETEKATNYAFLKVIVTNAARGKNTTAEAQAAIKLVLPQYPTVSKYYTEESPETLELIKEAGILPF
jgi:hypothetical protein